MKDAAIWGQHKGAVRVVVDDAKNIQVCWRACDLLALPDMGALLTCLACSAGLHALLMCTHCCLAE